MHTLSGKLVQTAPHSKSFTVLQSYVLLLDDLGGDGVGGGDGRGRGRGMTGAPGYGLPHRSSSVQVQLTGQASMPRAMSFIVMAS